MAVIVTRVDPEAWVTSTFRALKSYLLFKSDSDIYNILNNFPETDLFVHRQPFDKTIIHFEIDDAANRTLGFGDNVVDTVFDDVLGTVTPIEAQWHTVNFDVGIWASAASGGVTARLNAFQLLNDLFVGTLAFRELMDATDIELVSFTGGHFTEEQINDLPIWRVSNMTLIVRVFSKRMPIPIPYIDSSTVIPAFVDVENTTINDN